MPRGPRVRAFAASLVVVSLLAPGALGARTGCGVCPPDCPMHHQVASEAESQAMPCHRAATAGARDDGPAVRAACGRTEKGDVTVQLRDRTPSAVVGTLPPLRAPEPRIARAHAVPAADVPTAPPQDGRSL